MNTLDILLIFLTAGMLAGAVLLIRRNRRAGKSCMGCSGSCASCAGACRREDDHMTTEGKEC